MDNLTKNLNILYWAGGLPAVIGIIVIEFLHPENKTPSNQSLFLPIIQSFFVFAVPIWARITLNKFCPNTACFNRMQYIYLINALIATYIATYASYVISGNTMCYLVYFLALYALYFYYPSKLRITLEQEKFEENVKKNNTTN